MPTHTFADGTVVSGYTGNFIGGWGIQGWQWHIALVRLSFPFLIGYLLSKTSRHIRVRGGFWWCSLLIVLVLSIPQLGGADHKIYNGLYETAIIMLLFPTIVSMGAGSRLNGARSQRFCKFLGDISFPIYITHYPLIYLQMSWAAAHEDAPLSTHIFVSVSLFFLSILVAYALLKMYDEPVRDWLKEHWLRRNCSRSAK